MGAGARAPAITRTVDAGGDGAKHKDEQEEEAKQGQRRRLLAAGQVVQEAQVCGWGGVIDSGNGGRARSSGARKGCGCWPASNADSASGCPPARPACHSRRAHSQGKSEMANRFCGSVSQMVCRSRLAPQAWSNTERHGCRRMHCCPCCCPHCCCGCGCCHWSGWGRCGGQAASRRLAVAAAEAAGRAIRPPLGALAAQGSCCCIDTAMLQAGMGLWGRWGSGRGGSQALAGSRRCVGALSGVCTR